MKSGCYLCRNSGNAADHMQTNAVRNPHRPLNVSTSYPLNALNALNVSTSAEADRPRITYNRSYKLSSAKESANGASGSGETDRYEYMDPHIQVVSNVLAYIACHI